MSETKIFDKWTTDGIQVRDLGLEKYINLIPYQMPKSRGKHRSQFHKSKMSIVERLMNKLIVPGHRGKKHTITSGRVSGKSVKTYKILKQSFERIEQITKKNPVEVFVRAIENSALREEIAAYQVGGIIVRRSVITSPQRRVDVSLKNIVQAAYRKSFGKRDTIVDSLTNEIIGAYNNDPSKSDAIREKERIEREAEGAR